MPTILTSLPRELQLKIYEYALPDVTITFELKTRLRAKDDHDFGSEVWIYPSRTVIKARLVAHKKLIALLFMNRTINQCVRDLIYKNISLRWDSQNAYPDTSDWLNECLINEFMAGRGMKSLMDRTNKNFLPGGLEDV